MKRNDSYTLKKLAGVPYLLPYGQMQADFKRGMQFNETGAFLWEILEQEHTRDELLSKCAEHYEAAESDLPLLEKDIEQFLSEMISRGIFINEWKLPKIAGAEQRCFSIAGLNLCLYGSPEAIPPEFNAFAIEEPTSVHQTVALYPGIPAFRQNGRLLIRDKELTVIDAEDRYVLEFPCMPELSELHLSKDGQKAILYYLPPLSEAHRVSFFHVLRLIYLYLASRLERIVLHSASILYQGKAWLFSGPSGTGKSTHTGLWHDILQTPYINGDLNLLAMNERPVIHGLPWCGTSGLYDTNTYPLGGIILLRQSPENRVEELSPDKKLLLTLQRLISPSWTSKMLDTNLKTIEQILPHILVCRLYCTIDKEAVMTIKDRIDRHLSSD